MMKVKEGRRLAFEEFKLLPKEKNGSTLDFDKLFKEHRTHFLNKNQKNLKNPSIILIQSIIQLIQTIA